MPTAPAFTLTATLEDLTGAAAGTTANPAKLRICLCAFGPVLPTIAGTAMVAKAGPMDFYSTGSAISTLLWGNDQITPAGTFYSIEVLDGEDNVVQCGAYILTGSGGDLSSLAQIVPPYGFLLPSLIVAEAAGAVPGTAYTSPGPVVLVFYNGTLLTPGLAFPILSYTLSGGTTINLNFATETDDVVSTLYIA